MFSIRNDDSGVSVSQHETDEKSSSQRISDSQRATRAHYYTARQRCCGAVYSNRPCLCVCLFVCLFVGPPYYSQHAVFASLLSAFFVNLLNIDGNSSAVNIVSTSSCLPHKKTSRLFSFMITMAHLFGLFLHSLSISDIFVN